MTNVGKATEVKTSTTAVQPQKNNSNPISKKQDESIFTQQQDTKKAEKLKELEKYKKEERKSTFFNGAITGILGGLAANIVGDLLGHESLLKHLLIGAPIVAGIVGIAYYFNNKAAEKSIQAKAKELGLVTEPAK